MEMLDFGRLVRVLLLQNVFSYYRMCSLTIECVLEWKCWTLVGGCVLLL